MKKLLAISLLLLALVFTVVACQDPEEPADTTVAETTKAEEPTKAPTQSEETTKAEEPTEDPGTVADPETTAEPETTKAPEPTKAPETTKEPDTTEEPETEAPDPNAPLSVFDADALNNNNADVPSVKSFERIDNFLRITPNTSDPNYYPFRNTEVKGGRYVAIKYRAPQAEGTAVQFYIGSTGTGPSNDSSMLRLSTIADGEWHIALFDTQPLIDAGIYDGSTVAYFRFDPLECDYILDAEGNPQQDPVVGWLRYDMPEGAYIDVEYVAFFNTTDGVTLYETAPAYLITADKIASGAVNTTTATLGDGFVTLTGTGGDGWVMVFNPGDCADLTSKIISLRYRTTVAAGGEFFVGSGGGPAGGTDEKFIDYTADGEWNTLYADVSDVAALSGAINYIRYDYFGDATDRSIDVAYIAIFDTIEQAMAYDAIINKLPENTNTFQSDIAGQGDNFKASDVGSFFSAGAVDVLNAGNCTVNPGESYVLAGYSGIYAVPTGTYAYSATIEDTTSTTATAIFVRGVLDFNFGDLGYYGHDSQNDHAGCGGIYVIVDDGQLYITIRSWTNNALVRNVYTVAVDSNKITVADNGNTVYIMAGDKTVATVAISGKRDFGYEGVAPDACAASVILTLAEQEPVAIADAVVASTHLSDVGLAVRHDDNKITFSEISLSAFSSVTIPALPAAPERLTSDQDVYLVGDPIMITAIGEGKDWVGIANRGADQSIAYYYVAEISGQAVNLFEKAADGAGTVLTTLPAGEYTIYLIPNDEALAGSTPIAQKDISIFDPIEINYVTDGLVSCYSGKGYSNTVWTDLVGDNDLKINMDDNNYISDTGLYSTNGKHSFNKNIVNLVNGDTFTVEVLLGDFVSIGKSFNTFMNSSNDNFALFRRNEGDLLEFKFAANPGTERPKIENGLELIDNSLITITYTVGGNCCVYVDGVLVGEKPSPNAMGANDLFVGHTEETKLFETTYKSIRFYDRALTADEVLANAKADGVAQ